MSIYVSYSVTCRYEKRERGKFVLLVDPREQLQDGRPSKKGMVSEIPVGSHPDIPISIDENP